MSISYAWEKLHVAVLALATSHLPLRERLDNAIISALIRLEVSDFPTLDMQEQFEVLISDLAPAGTQTKDALASWPDEDITRLAATIVSLYDSIARRYPID